MKSICNYYQPDFYHFSRNSIELAEVVFNYLSQNDCPILSKKEIKFADFFSGSGVVLFEFLLRVNSLKNNSSIWPADAIEKQIEYKDFWEKNEKLFLELANGDKYNTRLLIENIFEETERKYDIILGNPPFFSLDRSLHSENPLKRNCHFMKELEMKTLPDVFFRHLRPGGIFFFLAAPSSLDWFWKEDLAKNKIFVLKELRDAVIVTNCQLNKK